MNIISPGYTGRLMDSIRAHREVVQPEANTIDLSERMIELLTNNEASHLGPEQKVTSLIKRGRRWGRRAQRNVDPIEFNFNIDQRFNE